MTSLSNRNKASRNDFERAYGSYQDVIDDAEVEAVYIAIPSAFHEEWAIKCAKAGKHVLCEKPIAPTTESVNRIIATCNENNVVFLDGTFFKHHPRTEALKELIQSGELGVVSSVHSHFSFMMASEFSSGGKEAALQQIRINPATEPTGVLGDMAWYTVRFSLIAFNYELPVSASCTIVRKNEYTGAAEQVVGHLIFSGGRNASFEASFNQFSVQRSCVTGANGAVALDDTFLTSTFFPVTKDTATAFTAPAADSFRVTVKRGEWEERGISTGGKLQEEWMAVHFQECVEGKRDWKVWAKETVIIHTVLDKLWASANNGGRAELF
ncbi:UNVERIFIED_CONTAM: hypothetical protein HDU68_009005 [Siphonaria sp. JEL0065]|nr:hypothetical protein HDU68_009005 [Siphonaria sp. JEL0065]